MTTRWIDADGKSCSDCVSSARNPAFTVTPVLVCSSPKVVGERAGDPQACAVARSGPGQGSGRCGPKARFYEKRKG